VAQWTARKLDKKATAATAAMYKANEDSLRTTKAAIAKDKLEEIVKIANKTRTYHYSHTLPYSIKGAAIISNAMLPEYIRDIKTLKGDFQTAVDKFLNNYEGLKQEAKLVLNGLYNEDDYPTIEQLRRKFSIDVDFQPLPTAGNFILDIAEQDLKDIQADITAKVTDTLAAANKELWARVYDVIGSLKERLTPESGTGKAKTFRNSLISNIKTLCDVLPKLNITQDVELDMIAAKISAELAPLDPDDLRNNPAERKNALKAADAILQRVKMFTGEPAAVPVSTPAQDTEKDGELDAVDPEPEQATEITTATDQKPEPEPEPEPTPEPTPTPAPKTSKAAKVDPEPTPETDDDILKALLAKGII
jgi:hypothetical protein